MTVEDYDLELFLSFVEIDRDGLHERCSRNMCVLGVEKDYISRVYNEYVEAHWFDETYKDRVRFFLLLRKRPSKQFRIRGKLISDPERYLSIRMKYADIR